MSVESTTQVMERYWQAHDDLSMLADDVVFTIMADGEEAHTPEGVQGMLDHFYNVAFTATFETKTVVIGDGNAVIEGLVVGKHTGEFSGIPATGKDIRVPMVVVYDVEDDKIKRARIYFQSVVLMDQLGIRARAE